MTAVADLRGIEFARGRRSLPNDLIIGDRARGDIGTTAIALTCPPSGGFATGEPPQSKSQHDCRGDDAEAGRGKRRGAEKRHRNRILNGGRAGKRRHRERRGAKRDRRRHQPPRNVGGLKQRLRHRRQNKEGNEQADAAIRHQCTREHHRQYGAARTQPLGHEARDGVDRAAVVHELAEQRAEQEQREELREELRRAAHERLCPMGEQRLARNGSRDQCRRRRQQEHAPSAISQPDKQPQRKENAQKAHGIRPAPGERPDRGWNAYRYSHHASPGRIPRSGGPRPSAWLESPIPH